MYTRRLVSRDMSVEQSVKVSNPGSHLKQSAPGSEFFPYGLSNVDQKNVSFPAKNECSYQRRRYHSGNQNPFQKAFQIENRVVGNPKPKQLFGGRMPMPKETKEGFHFENANLYQQKERFNESQKIKRYDSRNRFNAREMRNVDTLRGNKLSGRGVGLAANGGTMEPGKIKFGLKEEGSRVKKMNKGKIVHKMSETWKPDLQGRVHPFNNTCGPIQMKELRGRPKRNQSLKMFGDGRRQKAPLRVNALNLSDNQLAMNKNHTRVSGPRKGTPMFKTGVVSSGMNRFQFLPSQSNNQIMANNSLQINFQKTSTRIGAGNVSEKMSRGGSKDILIYRRDEKTGELVGKDSRTVLMEPKREYEKVRVRAVSRDFGRGSSGKVLRKRGVSQEVKRGEIRRVATVGLGMMRR